MRLPLIDDAGRVLRRAWSVRLGILAAVLSAAEVGLPYLLPNWPPRVAAAVASLVTLAALLARFIAQPRMHDGNDDKPAA